MKCLYCKGYDEECTQYTSLRYDEMCEWRSIIIKDAEKRLRGDYNNLTFPMDNVTNGQLERILNEQDKKEQM